MKSFQSVQKYFAHLGLSATGKPFNQRIRIMFLMFAINSILICVFHIHEVTKFRDYVNATYVSSSSIAVNIQFAILILQMKIGFIFITMIDEIIESSKSLFLI